MKETYEERWARRNAALQKRLADIPSRFTNDALYEPRPVGVAVKDAEQEFFGTSFSVFEKQVKRAASAAAKQWPGILTADDAEQELWKQLMESPGSMQKLRDEFDDRNRLNALIQMGHQIGNKALIAYQVATGNFRYSVNDVKDILKTRPGDKKVTRTALRDLKLGMEALCEKNAAYAEAITDRYRADRVPQPGAKAVQLSRALTALTTHMNRAHKKQHASNPAGPGTRKAISTARAKAISQKQYNGEERFPNPGEGDRGRYEFTWFYK